ncbi:MAG: class I SAM-dependent methyltransferase [Candidatus Nanopelagicales bacterium]
MHRLYGDLAPWWPLISPPSEYVDEIPRLQAALGPPGRLLELGSGGGHVASHLLQFDRTLVDLAEPMLAVSRELNPDCRHEQGDMRTIRLNERFDAVLVHDAVDYLLTEDDVEQMLDTAAEHLVDGGRLVIVPDDIADTFHPGTTSGGSDDAHGRAARFLEWVHELQPGETSVQVDYVFVLRERDGSVDVVHEQHECGLFTINQWRRMLSDFTDVVVSVTDESWGEGVLITARRSRR